MRYATDRRQAERSIEDARNYAESVVETVREPLVVLTADLRVRSANRSFYQTFHVTPKETQDRLIYELGNGQWDSPQLRTLLEDVLRQNTKFHDYEVEHDFPAIGPKNMLLNARRLYLEGNHTELILLAIEDITERRQAEAAVKISEVRYRRLFEAAKDGILILDAATATITDANSFIRELLGYSHAELLGKELWEIGVFKDKEESKAAVRELQEKHYIRYDDLPLETKAGRRADVEFVSNVYSEDHQPVIQCNIRDITERKEAEVRFRTLVEEIPAITYISRYEPNCRAVYQSPQVESLLGFSVEEWYERPDLWVQRLHPDDKPLVLTAFQRTYVELVPFSEDYRLLTKDGAVLWVHDESRVVLDPCGAPKWIQGVMLDITERKRIEQTLRESEKRYQDIARKLVTAQEEERRRIAGELHDQMGQYLTALQLGLGSLEHLLSDNPTARDCLDKVKGIAEEIDQQMDRLALELRPAALDDLGLREVLVNYIEEWSQRSGIQVDLQCRGFKQRYLPSNVEIVMYRAVQETLTNVLKHARAEHVGVILECRDNEIYTIIEDDGCGFDLGAAQHCRPTGDRSLGLLSMKERIELLGGTCQVESKPGMGTTMFCRVALPEAFPRERE